MKALDCVIEVMISLVLASCVNCQDAKISEHYLLHYDRPAQYFEESLPLGNGQLGALIYGGVGEERISLNDITLWTGEPDLTPWTPDAWRYVDSVRHLLDHEDYAAANEVNRLIEGHKSEIYQPLGTLWLTDLQNLSFESCSEYERTLSLNDALATVHYVTPTGDTFTRECFTSAPDSVLVLRLTTTSRQGLHYRLQLSTLLPHTSHSDNNVLWSEGYVAYSTKPEAGKSEWFHYDPNRGIHFRTELRVITDHPNTCKVETDSTLLIEGGSSVTLLLSNVTSYNGPYNDPVLEGRDYRKALSRRLALAGHYNYEKLLERHLADYHPYFYASQIQLGTTPDSISQLTTAQQLRLYTEAYEKGDSLHSSNPDLEELYYQVGRYLLISSSRTQGVPANLQGLWNESVTPPWSGNYTVNINVEENYWPAEITGLSEMHQPFLTWIMQLPHSGSITAANYYGIDTSAIASHATAPWCICHNSDIWCMTNPTGYQQSSPEWSCWPLGEAWVTTHLWEHYSFTHDDAFLRQAYPVMKGAVAFVSQWMVERQNELITSPSTSPENHFITQDGVNSCTLYGGTADLAMIRELLIDTRKAALVLADIYPDYQCEIAFADTIQQLLVRLHPYQIGHLGNLQEWYYDWDDADPHHRHQSHLFGLYPGHHIDASQPELMRACARSLEIKGDRTTGWSSGWRINLQARLGNGQAAYNLIRRLLNYVSPCDYHGTDKRSGGGTFPNLFDSHPPFQIDGNFGGTAGIAEMLVQSTDEGVVRLLPALPHQWAEKGSITGICLRGGYRLDMTWQHGRIQHVTLRNQRTTLGSLHLIGPEFDRTVTLPSGQTMNL